MDYSERMLRRRIREIPDGDYVAEGFPGRRRRQPGGAACRSQGHRAGSGAIRRWSTRPASAPQVATAFNVPFEGSTKVACYFAFRALLLDTSTTTEYIPQNQGSFRPIEVVSPEGSIFNPKFPAACQSRFCPVPAPGRPHLQGARAGDPGQSDGRLRRDSLSLRLFRRAAQRRTIGYWSRSMSPLMAGVRRPTVRIRSTS